MRNKKLILAGILLALFSIFTTFAAMAIAQDAPAPDTAKRKERTLGDNIMASMPVGGLIILINVVAFGLIIEHFVNVRRDKVLPPEIVQELEILFDDEDYEGALQFCESNPGFVTNIVGAALPRMSNGYDAMVSMSNQVGEEEAVKLQLKISYLGLAGAIGPLLGLFGTVTGMVDAFSVIASKPGGANAQDLAEGIMQALMTTVEGLIVAIPCVGFYFVFKNKVTRIVMEGGIIVSELLDRFRPGSE